MLKTKDNYIVDEAGKKIVLRGFNLGGWLMMEGYILFAPNIAERIFKDKFRQAQGASALEEFETSFRDNFIQESDFKNIASLGFNCVRLPFNHKLIEKEPFSYSQEGLSYLQKAVAWAKKYGIWVILDLHAAPGSQNTDWHSDSTGESGLWNSPSNIERTIKLWSFLAEVFKDEEAVAGYDLLNEPIVSAGALNRFYAELVQEIRKTDKNHILFLEPVNWAQDLDTLKKPKYENLAFSIHFYQPLEFCFNTEPTPVYPFGDYLYKKGMQDNIKHLKDCFKISQGLKVPILVGEFGVNDRLNQHGEKDYIRDLVKLFAGLDFSWTYWTYKAVKNTAFPDGFYHYVEDPAWVNRQGPIRGWDNYSSLWQAHKDEIIDFWKTASYGIDSQLLASLREQKL
ncbi:MAG: glycoside hydrolase family 5 protein [Candidatus Omnitrophica bacterium]|nr:glycoside hydrolase family 5 protein [Candidatus Omnitrophota bacterium]HOX54125.1 glycoside hydrolase family 5 protein [Candidatus Omnitrophota bacterium]